LLKIAPRHFLLTGALGEFAVQIHLDKKDEIQKVGKHGEERVAAALSMRRYFTSPAAIVIQSDLIHYHEGKAEAGHGNPDGQE
jgi:hypothetical protein